MEEVTIKVKTEKLDPEIEQKIQQHLDVKEEPVDDQESSDSSSSSQSNVEDEPEEKKNVELAKSSNELLTELFQVFNAAPPEELLNDENLLKKAKKSKKSKKEKRKKHKKSKNTEVTNEVDPDEFNLDKKEKHKHKKKKKHKNKNDEKVKERKRSKSKDKEKETAKVKTELEATRHKSKEHKEHNKHKIIEKEDKERLNKKSHTSAIFKKEKEDDRSKRHEEKTESSRKRHATEDKINEPPSKIRFNIEKRTPNSYYNGGISERDDSLRDSKIREDKIHENKSKDHHIKTERTNRSSERNSHRDNNSNNRRHHHSRDRIDRNELSDLSLSDEETYLRERARPTENRRRDHNYQNIRNRRDLDRHRRRSPNRTRHRTRSRSRSRDLGIDKKRLLEIARKNAISMFKRGNLPGCANMSEDVKDKVLLQMRYGGRTVQDLTDFCRKISNGEPLPELSSDNDSDIDRDGNTKPFHHPFQVKDRDPIVLQIRNAIPLPVTARKEEQTKAITMQFPVSSGQQHRMSESWIPVEANPTPLPPLPVATQSTTIFKQSVQKNVFEKALPAAEQQEPAFKPLNVSGTEPDSTVSTEAITNTTMSSTTTTTTTVATLSGSSTQVTSTFVPDVPVPSSTTSDSVFPEVNSTSVDVSSIISKRLNALRRLQENPLDSEAIKMMYNSQKEMSSWASSKHIPGQFTGSTGANILTVHELNAGPQIRARRDQLTSSKPVTGGMGMHLLQKMGWKPGEGLGREKTGALQPLLLDVKLDKRGLVAKDDVGVNNVKPNVNKKRPNNFQETLQNFQNKHPVCILNELSSKRKWTPPMYEIVNEGGPSHSKRFLFSVQFNGQIYTPPEGSNTKKEAKMLAAKFCLEQIGILSAT